MRLLKFGLALLILACGGQPQSNDAPPTLQPRLPTGNYLDPAGTSLQLGSFPLNAVLSPEGDRLVVLLNGWREQGLQIVERSTGRIVQTVEQKAAFIGLAFAPDGKTLYVSGGNQEVIYRYNCRDKMATLRDTIIVGRKDSRGNGTYYPAGMAASSDGAFLYVAENLADSLAIVNLWNSQVKHVPAGRYPYGVVEDADGNVIVSAWGQNVLTVIDPQQGKVLAKIDGGRHPSAMVTTRDKSKLFVVSGSTDRVTIVDTRQRKVIGALQSSNGPGGEGATPNGLALSADERTLYVAEADNNAIAVWDLAPARLKGRIPVEWYPTGVVVAGDSVLVINGKGKGTAPNPALPHPGTGTQNRDETTRRAYALGQLNGSLTTLTSNEFGDLAIQKMTPRVEAANGWNKSRTAAAYPPFEHVIYIIKENRTYDQVFGDLPQGDGDTSLVFFPRNVSPNHHALAERFGLFDRFFVNAEVSAQGHNWSTAAYTTDYVEKTVPSGYSDRGRSYDWE
ncbi:MAG TPA: SMP-30/gluconolactonase/LRE family protein, partial [Longimicrobiales bacterium]|nr:SMP-30/gluconolactonase/LRE family protein [Longimicrobiales bacterium]